MTVEEIKEALLGLSEQEKKSVILETLPVLTKEAMRDPGFMMQLFPVMLGILKESGMDLQQLVQMAALFGDQRNQA